MSGPMKVRSLSAISLFTAHINQKTEECHNDYYEHANEDTALQKGMFQVDIM
jgi:hypothetical protein